jgi:4'-phosphopantetheinyl transferase
MRDTLPFDNLTLPDNAAHVWLARPPACDPARLAARYLPLLSDDERARHRALMREVDRHAYLTAHALQRLVLAGYTGVAPEQLRFQRGARGKPHPVLAPPHDTLSCNLSHTSGLVGCMVTRGRACGLDIETVRSMDDMDGVADIVCSPAERALLDRLPTAERDRYFFSLWTLKEAYVKATGEGIGIDLTRVSFTLGAGAVACRLGGAPADADWQFQAGAPDAEHALAVALHRQLPRTPHPLLSDAHESARRGAPAYANATITIREVRLDTAEPDTMASSSSTR